MPDKQYAGYKKSTLFWLKNHNLEVWDEIEIIKDNSVIRGVILPRSELADPRFISLKLPTGYNIGLNPEEVQSVRKINHIRGEYRIPKPDIIQRPNLPFIPILGCGGTIASRLDYQTGGTIPALTPEELFSSFPEIADLARIETQLLFDIFSENVNFTHYEKILRAIEATIKNKEPQGIVLTHGTDTMAYTAAALSFAITNSPVPIVITGSQRSSDRPSSDAFFNLYHSVLYATSPQAKKEVVVIMHEESSDTSTAIHKGTRLRKMHSSRRDTFKTIGGNPIGRIVDSKIQYFDDDNKYAEQIESNEDKEFIISKKFEKRIGLIYHYPGIQPGLIEHFIETGYKGLVFAGTGLGHVSTELVPMIKKAIENEIIVVMTTQCLHGFTGLSVYESGRQLQAIGVIPVNILPETAYIKLSSLLGNYKKTNKIKELMKTDLKGEFLYREKFREFT
ncbi:MAG: Glu-tRNA(Gln) amidotransferase subunit GatD [Candidatus Heimdallarchaeota archaeon]|nr:MAG: Glu-tRNA(Gln) amidotransferase subunit GatD [Candidatus Heimdallarchaeota archaeon]